MLLAPESPEHESIRVFRVGHVEVVDDLEVGGRPRRDFGICQVDPVALVRVNEARVRLAALIEVVGAGHQPTRAVGMPGLMEVIGHKAPGFMIPLAHRRHSPARQRRPIRPPLGPVPRHGALGRNRERVDLGRGNQPAALVVHRRPWQLTQQEVERHRPAGHTLPCRFIEALDAEVERNAGPGTSVLHRHCDARVLGESSRVSLAAQALQLKRRRVAVSTRGDAPGRDRPARTEVDVG